MSVTNKTATAAPKSDKPIVRQLGELAWSVSHGRHRATVRRVKSVIYRRDVYEDTITIHGSNGQDYAFTLAAKPRSEADLLARVVGYFDAVDDMQVWCDEQLGQGTEGVLAVTKKNAKKLIAALAELQYGLGVQAVDGRWSEGCYVFVVPGLCMRYCGNEIFYCGKETGYGREIPPRVFTVGSECVVGSFNLKYLGHVTKITDRFVWVRDQHATKQKRHTFESFRSYNRGTVAEAHEHNAVEFMHI